MGYERYKTGGARKIWSDGSPLIFSFVNRTNKTLEIEGQFFVLYPYNVITVIVGFGNVVNSLLQTGDNVTLVSVEKCASQRERETCHKKYLGALIHVCFLYTRDEFDSLLLLPMLQYIVISTFWYLLSAFPLCRSCQLDGVVLVQSLFVNSSIVVLLHCSSIGNIKSKAAKIQDVEPWLQSGSSWNMTGQMTCLAKQFHDY